MKVITAETDFLAYQKIFKHLKVHKSTLVIWQLQPDGRSIIHSHLNSFHQDSKLMHLDKTEDIHFYEEMPVFCYSEEVQLIFKTKIFEFADRYFSLYMPEELKMIEEVEATRVKVGGMDFSTIWRSKKLGLDQLNDTPNYYRVKSMSQRSSRDQDLLNTEFEGVSLDEEDRMFADKRESPRARPKLDKRVRVKRKDSDQVFNLKLFDLSRGGLGFISEVETLFPKGESIYITGFDNFDLDDPLIGKIMSIRSIEDGKMEWKIGIKFEEGQS